jgi:hypothetical protein
MYKWRFALPYSADLLFVHMYHTAASMDEWNLLKVDQASRLVQISAQVSDVPSDRDGSIISIRALYRTNEKSEMELVLQTNRLIEYKEAISRYSIETIIRLNGKGLNKSLGDAINLLGCPIAKTIGWHLKAKGLESEFMCTSPSELRATLRELVGPGADMLMEEMLGDKDHSDDESKDKDPSGTDCKSKFRLAYQALRLAIRRYLSFTRHLQSASQSRGQIIMFRNQYKPKRIRRLFRI